MDKRIRAFLAIAQNGSITHAARQIGIAQPALTKNLQKIEYDVGSKLFTRNPRGLTLTRSGREYLVYCRRIDREHRNAKEAVAAIERGHIDSISVGAGPNFHLTSLPKAFAVLLEEYPETRLRCVVGNHLELLPSLLDGDLDLVLGRIQPEKDTETLLTIPLIEAETGIALRKGHPLSASALKSTNYPYCGNLTGSCMNPNWIRGSLFTDFSRGTR